MDSKKVRKPLLGVLGILFGVASIGVVASLTVSLTEPNSQGVTLVKQDYINDQSEMTTNDEKTYWDGDHDYDSNYYKPSKKEKRGKRKQHKDSRTKNREHSETKDQEESSDRWWDYPWHYGDNG